MTLSLSPSGLTEGLTLKHSPQGGYDFTHCLDMCSGFAIHIPKKHRSTVMDKLNPADITAAYVDAWFNHEITDEELEERCDQHPLSTYEEPPIGVIQDT